jgi:Multidrug resistance efflux pump
LSKNSYESAVARYADLQKQLQFAADQARKQLSISQTIAQDYVVRSQTSGRVYQLAIKTGELVSPQMPLAVIGDAEAFLVELQVDEADISQVLVGQSGFF